MLPVDKPVGGRGVTRRPLDLSVIIPVLNEEGNLAPLFKRLSSTLEESGGSYEIVFADDGSTDRTPEILRHIGSRDNRVRIVRLGRSVGQHRAILAGFEQSRGTIVVTLDGDLQNHPEDIPRLLDKMGEGYDVVAGWRRRRQDPFHRRAISTVLSWLASRLTRVRLRDYGCMLRAYRRWVFEKMRLEGCSQIFIPTSVNLLGVRVAEVEVGHSMRRTGRSKYGFLSLVGLYLDLVSGFPTFPAWLIRAVRGMLTFFGAERGARERQQWRGRREGVREECGWKICVLAYGEIGYVCLEELIKGGETVVAVVTQQDDPEEHIWFRSVKELAGASRIPVYQPRDVNDPAFLKVLKQLGPDIILCFTYRQILSREVLALPPLGALNLHPSLLPKYRGRCPANWVLVKGEKRTGVTLHYMEEKVDAGDMVGQTEVDIAEDDTIQTLYGKLTRASVGLLRDALPKLKSGSAQRVPQNHEEATYFSGRTPEDGRIEWEKPAQETYNLVRAVTHPYPGAFFYCDGQKVFCWKAAVSERSGMPGEVLEVREEGGVLVSCREGAILLESVQVEGGGEEKGADWARRRKVEQGAVLS